ncbi:hypothetical protein QBC40DRAFT_315943 [Triangularia verruculosa]|uniref:Uncharacterized protein n=1 Tax=Triangularia verruculosa TaxID=2587418 RepID=A0AAN6X899_9PEZI|nr:hypothetical protein QBC40DRAFT_315943 [Triangularia verruculosa]
MASKNHIPDTKRTRGSSAVRRSDDIINEAVTAPIPSPQRLSLGGAVGGDGMDVDEPTSRNKRDGRDKKGIEKEYLSLNKNKRRNPDADSEEPKRRKAFEDDEVENPSKPPKMAELQTRRQMVVLRDEGIDMEKMRRWLAGPERRVLHRYEKVIEYDIEEEAITTLDDDDNASIQSGITPPWTAFSLAVPDTMDFNAALETGVDIEVDIEVDSMTEVEVETGPETKDPEVPNEDRV